MIVIFGKYSTAVFDLRQQYSKFAHYVSKYIVYTVYYMEVYYQKYVI